MSLSQADADLAAIRGQMQAQQALVSDLQARVRSVPEVEAELSQLNRDYEVNKRNYDTLVQRLESARISEQAQKTEDVKFRVIEPPTVPFKPSGPQRALLNTLALLAALGVGLGIAIVLSQLRPTFATRDALQKITGLPVLGSITSAVQAAMVPWYRRQGVMVVGAVSLLVVVFILNVVLSTPLRAALRAVTS
jgi:hypothetical protein